MKRLFSVLAALAILFQQVLVIQPGTVEAGYPAQPGEAPNPGEQMPGYPDPEQPIPFHKPGYVSKNTEQNRVALASIYKPWSDRFRTLSADQKTSQVAYSGELDPLKGNYTMVNWDQLAVVTTENNSSNGGQRVRTTKTGTLVSDPLSADNGKVLLNQQVGVQNSLTGASGFSKSQSADLNGDGIDELLTLTETLTETQAEWKLQIGNLSNRRLINGSPAAASPSAGENWVFARGYDDGLWVLKGANWEPLGGNLATAPSAAALGPGLVRVVVGSTDGNLYACPVQAATTACAWSLIGSDGLAGTITGEPAITGSSADSYDVFARSSYNHLWHRAYRTGWQPWEDLGGYILSSPAVTHQGERIDLVAAGFDGTLMRRWRETDGSGWSAWENLGQKILFNPAIVSPAPGKYDVFVTAEVIETVGQNQVTNYRIARRSFDGAAWGAWETLAASKTYASPAAVVLLGSQKVGMVYTDSGRLVVKSATRDTPGAAWADAPDSPALGMWSARTLITNLGKFSTGHFIPNGRMQAANIFVAAGDGANLHLNGYKFGGGFSPTAMKASDTLIPLTKVADANAAITSAVGDFDGDGSDELAEFVYSQNNGYVYIIKINADGSAAVTGSRMLFEGWTERTILMSSGDFNGDGHDDLAIFNCYKTDATCPLTIFTDISISGAGYDLGAAITGSVDWGYSFTNEHSLTTGDFNDFDTSLNKSDELVYGGIEWVIVDQGFYNHQHTYTFKTHMYRLENGSIKKVASGDFSQTLLQTTGTINSWFGNYLYQIAAIGVRLEAGDLNRDNYAELTYFYQLGYACYHSSNNLCDKTTTPAKSIYVYDYDFAQTTPWVKKIEFQADPNLNATSGEVQAELVTGNFGGEGIYISKPSYRLARNVGNLIARVNAPPRIVVGDQVITPNNLATLVFSTDVTKQLSITAQSAWNLSASGSITLGDAKKEANYFSLSVEASYGRDFEKVDRKIDAYTIKSGMGTDNDLLYFALTNFKIYEYPVVDAGNGDLSSMTVTWPAPTGNTGYQTFLQDTSNGCSNLYNPGHDIDNPLSYPMVATALPGFTGGNLISGDALSTKVDNTQTLQWSSTTTQTQTQKTAFKIGIGLEGQYQNPTGKFTVKLGVKGEYSTTNVVSQEVSFTKASEIQLIFPKAPDLYEYSLSPYFYWDKNKAMVLDYVIPENGFPGGYWDRALWTTPDLAFIRPRKGGKCPLVNGENQDDISPEITFNNNTPISGNDVTVTATVHNFSLAAASEVHLDFYQGNPANHQLLTCATPVANFSLDPRASAEKNCTFQTSGFGEQRIYAVASSLAANGADLDPSNNQAFNVLSVVRPWFTGADPGRMNNEDEKDGILMAMDTAAGQKTSLFIPYTGIPQLAVTSYRLEPAQGPVKHTFLVAAMQVDDRMVWASTLQKFGAQQAPDHSIPPAWVAVQYADQDLRKNIDDENALTLYVFDATTRKWKDAQATCGPVVRDTLNNVLMAPVCSTGTYAVMSSPTTQTFVPLLNR